MLSINAVGCLVLRLSSGYYRVRGVKQLLCGARVFSFTF